MEVGPAGLGVEQDLVQNGIVGQLGVAEARQIQEPGLQERWNLSLLLLRRQ